MVTRMEQEELELISRLQNTQLLQKAAYDDLESALTVSQVAANESGSGGLKKSATKSGTKPSQRK